MNKKAITASTLVLMAITIATITQVVTTSEIEASTESFSKNEFKMADDVHAILTFKFKTGTEKIDFPVFKMNTDAMSRNTLPTFEVQGIVGSSSYLYKVMDSKWEMRGADSGNKVTLIRYNDKHFDVDVEFTKENNVIKKINYSYCRITDFKVDTLYDKEEGYTTEKTGFAIVDIVNFQCEGINILNDSKVTNNDKKNDVIDFGKHKYKSGADAHAITTFKFYDGVEKIDFPIFKTTTKYLSNTQAGFEVQGIVNSYPLLNNAINRALDSRSHTDGINMGQEFFSVDVELQKGDVLTRTLKYSDCRVSGYKVNTEFNKEEGFTHKNGFAIVDIVNILCNGQTGIQPLNEIAHRNGLHDSKEYVIEHLENPHLMANNVHAVVTFTHDNRNTEKINFPVFKQTGKVLVTANPSFELQGLINNYPLLQNSLDESKSRGPSSDGYYEREKLISDIKIELKRNDEVLRGFEYNNCRINDYQIDTQYDGDETYLGKTGFALLNYYTFECQGYKPLNPTYDAMHKIEHQRTTQNSLDIPNRSFDTWDDRFTAKKSSGN